MDQKRPLLIFSLLVCLLSSFSNASTPRILSRYCTFSVLSASDKTIYYDLRSLSSKSHYETVKNGSDTYLLNICSTTTAFKDGNVAGCKQTSSVCLMDSSKPGEAVEIASVHATKLQLENDKLVMRFTNEEVDPKINPGCEKINTTILFTCVPGRQNEHSPKLTGRSNCTFDFEWSSHEACQDPHTVLEPNQMDGSLNFSISGTIVDLNEVLKPQTIKGEYQNVGKTEMYDFVIKINETNQYAGAKDKNNKPVDLSRCADSFVCQVNTTDGFSRAIGQLKKPELKYANGAFHLFLSSNSTCGRDQDKIKNASAIFNFYCDANAPESIIRFRAENNLCHYVFNVTSSKICDYEALIKPVTEKPVTEKPATEKPNDDKPKTNSPTTTTSAKPPTTSAPIAKPDPAEKESSSKFQGNPDENGSNTTAFGLVILALVTIVGVILVFFALINDDRRSWLQKRLRRVINPQTTTRFTYSQGYSQLPPNNILLMNNNQTDNFSSPYSPTVIPKAGQIKYDKLLNEANSTPRNSIASGNVLASQLPSHSGQPPQYDLRNNSNNVRSSIREQFDRLRLINDNDLGVSSGDFHHSIGFRSTERGKNRPNSSRLNLKDEELDLLT